MKDTFVKTAIVLGFATAGFASMLSTSSAEAPPVQTSLSPTVSMDAKAHFRQAVSIVVEHEPLSLPAFLMQAGAETRQITRRAQISVRGLPGESIVMTCGVSSRADDGRMYTDDRNLGVRDCSGENAVVARHYMSGQRIDSEICLSDDLLPGPGGTASNSSISIEVTYI